MEADIIVIGGGAAGLAAAISARDAAKSTKIIVLEAQNRAGKKLLATGNGRCNLMNEFCEPDAYRGDQSFIAPALDNYKRKYAAFWARLGLPLAKESEGRMYPKLFQASAVLDVLRLALRERNISEICDVRVDRIISERGALSAVSETGVFSGRRIVLATGGLAGKGLGENDSFLRLLKPLGHRFVPTYPALCCLKTPKQALSGLKGVRLKGEIGLWQGERELTREQGEILFQDDAISGIAAMQLSLVAAPLIQNGIKLHARMSPLCENARNTVFSRVKAFPGRAAQELLCGEVNRLIALNILKSCAISPAQSAGSIENAKLEALAEKLDDWRVPVTGVGSFAQAQVMAGGADTRDFEPETLESRRVSGLYACGELLDVTGPCGGYNLEWAWASGMLAGGKAAESL